MKRNPLVLEEHKTPWYMIDRDGHPHHPGPYQTSAILQTMFPPTYRNYLGEGKWSEAQPTPDLAAQCEMPTPTNPVFWRGVKTAPEAGMYVYPLEVVQVPLKLPAGYSTNDNPIMLPRSTKSRDN